MVFSMAWNWCGGKDRPATDTSGSTPTNSAAEAPSIKPSRAYAIDGNSACLSHSRSLILRACSGGNKTIGHREPSVPVPNSLSPHPFWKRRREIWLLYQLD